ncbi:MAG: hypothetical protein ABR543_09885 [Gemmatimonadaceae bacterium]
MIQLLDASLGGTRARYLALILIGVAQQALRAQVLPAQQQDSARPPASIAPFRVPRVALVQPEPGGAIPQDKPVAVFRYAPGEPADPIDASSFRVSMDGRDRSASFQVTATEAWGSLAGGSDSTLALGVHELIARICSTRGACASVQAQITVVPSPAADPSVAPPRNGKRTLLELIILAAKKLLQP